MKSNLIFLLLLILLGSCTIQKRVHNRGWHVQWNAKRSVSHQDSKEDEATSAQTKLDEHEDDHFSHEPDFEEHSVIQSETEETAYIKLDAQFQSDEVSTIESSIRESSCVHPTDRVVYKIKTGRNHSASVNRNSGKLAVPITYFILAGVAALIAVYFVMIVQSAADLTGLIALFGAVVFGSAAIVLIILALITLTLILTVRSNT
jgi:hypothetical protein